VLGVDESTIREDMRENPAPDAGNDVGTNSSQHEEKVLTTQPARPSLGQSDQNDLRKIPQKARRTSAPLALFSPNPIKMIGARRARLTTPLSSTTRAGAADGEG
jgi:hypothetical protein